MVESRRSDLLELATQQPARVAGLYNGLPYNPDGYSFDTRQALTIRQHAGVASNEHLPIDVAPGTAETVKNIMVGEHERALRLSELANDDHTNLRGLIHQHYGPAWEYAQRVTEQFALQHGLDPKSVSESMLDAEDRAYLSLLREEAKSRLSENPIVLEVRAKQRKYLDVIERTRKMGIVPIAIDRDGTITVDVFPVPYAFYPPLATPENSEASGRIGELTATAAGIVTSDNIYIVQIRGEGNNIYGDMLGTSAGGLVDSRRNEKVPGSVRPATTATIIENTVDEMDWEVGQDDPNRITKIRIITLIKEGQMDDEDGNKITIPHYEAVLYVRTNMTFEEFARNAWEKKGRPSPRPGHEFAEQFIGIPADPDMLLQFLEVPRPLPATHYCPVIGVGYMSVYERTGNIQAAEDWQRQAEKRVAKSTRQVDVIARSHWNGHPEERAAYAGDISQYDPHYPAGRQGLGNAVEVVRQRGIPIYQWRPQEV